MMLRPIGWLTFVALAACHAPSAPTPEALAQAGAKALVATLAQPEAVELDAPRVASFVGLSLACVNRPFPNKPSHIYEAADELRPPEEVTPAFYGCFDWHSAVHGHWAMLRLLKTFAALPDAERVRIALDRHLSQENLERELAFFREARNATFERPYGWGWLLRLAAELETLDDDEGKRWRAAVHPFADYLAKQSLAYLERLTTPIREGTHASTAFALAHMLDYADTIHDRSLGNALRARARDFYGADRHCPTAYEPSGEDFISPCLAEADVMRRVLGPETFAHWLTDFLPPFDSPEFRPLTHPTEVLDLKDPRIGHLIGLAFQRAWAMRGVAAGLPLGDARSEAFQRLADIHVAKAVSQMFDSGYGGEHWLASFAIFAMTETPR